MIIDGRKIAENILSSVKVQVAALPFQPVFCDILVGTNPVSAQYVDMKGSRAEKVGIKFQRANFPENITTENLLAEIQKLNKVPNMCGLIVQLPLPPHIDRQAVLNAIDPQIDVDCTGEVNTNFFYQGQSKLSFPTAAAVVKILDSININLAEKQILVVGQGQLVGKPVSFLLTQRGLKVLTADKNTPSSSDLMKNADVIISAAGKGGLISGDKIKPGSIIIDAGTSESNGGIVGDVDRASVEPIASFLSPVPGGVGPVTVAMLLSNVALVASLKKTS